MKHDRSEAQAKAQQCVVAIEEFLEARATLDVAAKECYANNGVIIYDIVHREHDVLNAARKNLVELLTDLQVGG